LFFHFFLPRKYAFFTIDMLYYLNVTTTSDCNEYMPIVNGLLLFSKYYEYAMGFRENLKAELTYKGMLVKELAALSSVNKRTIDNYLRENGSIPSVEAAVSIARILNVSVEYLVTGKSSGKPLSLPPDIRAVLDILTKLDAKDRRIVRDLCGSLLERRGLQ
jgi:transcriptional regulator with XRE-family HTH domain